MEYKVDLPISRHSFIEPGKIDEQVVREHAMRHMTVDGENVLVHHHAAKDPEDCETHRHTSYRGEEKNVLELPAGCLERPFFKGHIEGKTMTPPREV